jgi:hypothetical protein
MTAAGAPRLPAVCVVLRPVRITTTEQEGVRCRSTMSRPRVRARKVWPSWDVSRRVPQRRLSRPDTPRTLRSATSSRIPERGPRCCRSSSRPPCATPSRSDPCSRSPMGTGSTQRPCGCRPGGSPGRRGASSERPSRSLGSWRSGQHRVLRALRLRGHRPGLRRHPWRSAPDVHAATLSRAPRRVAEAGRSDQQLRIPGLHGAHAVGGQQPPLPPAGRTTLTSPSTDRRLERTTAGA